MVLTTNSIENKNQQNRANQYVSEFVRDVLGISDEHKHLIPDVPEYLKRLFLRTEEYQTTHRDQWGNWEHPYSENYQSGTLWIPEMDLWINDLKHNLQSQGIKTYPLWPNNHEFAVCLTHDVDHVSHQYSVFERIREVYRNLRCKDHRGYDQVVKAMAKCFLKPSKFVPDAKKTLELCYSIEKEHGVSASYFFTVSSLESYSKHDCLYDFKDNILFDEKKQNVADVMQFLYQEGFDIGLHGSYYSAIEEGLLEVQKDALEQALGSKVYTTRQHWLHWKFPLTPKLQQSAGFTADTTVGYNRNIGFRAGTSFPFYIFDMEKQEKLDLLEVPLIIQDGALLGNNALEFTPHMALNLVNSMIDEVHRVGGCLTFLFHPDIFIKEGTGALYKQIIQNCLERNAWVTNLKEIQQWWKERKQKYLQSSEGLLE